MNTREAAAILDVTRDQVSTLCKAGQLPGSRLVRKSKRNRSKVWKVSGASVHKRRRALSK